jgi:hypothetical protein
VATQEQRIRFLQGHLKEQRLQSELWGTVLCKPNCEHISDIETYPGNMIQYIHFNISIKSVQGFKNITHSY